MAKSVVLITGASHGLGKALALVYAQKGHALFLIGRDTSALDEIVAQTKLLGIEVYSLTQDLIATDAIDNIQAFINKENLDISVLINNAGLGSYTKFVNLDQDAIYALLMVNIYSLVALTQRILPTMLAKNAGTIINIASVYAYTSIPSQVLYAASKAFVKSFSIGLSMELNGSGVHACCICPGAMSPTHFNHRMGLQTTSNYFATPTQVIATKIYKAAKKHKFILIPMWYNRVFVFTVVMLTVCLPVRWLSRMVSFFVYRVRKVERPH